VTENVRIFLPAPRARPKHAWRRRLAWSLAGAGALLTVLTLLWLRHALVHRWVTFPREARAWADLRNAQQPVHNPTSWREYRGILHSHSLLSHDCQVPFDEILRALQESGTDFVALSDHAQDGRADFSAQWRGLHEGKLFIPGYEMRRGWMPFGVRTGVTLNNATDDDTLGRQILEGGGILFYAHPEEPRDWTRNELVGMEIYNIHADLKDESDGLLGLLPDLLLSQRRYPDHVFRLIFDPPSDNLQRWDTLNGERPIVGIAGNDCHQNTGFRLVLVDADTLRLEDTSPETLREWSLNSFTRGLVRLGWGSLIPGRQLFHVQLDPYPRMTRFVRTHVLARELTQTAILDSLRSGRVFVGFDLMLDSTGFLWLAEDDDRQVVMGESIPWSPSLRLRALAPNDCRFNILLDGVSVHRHTGREVAWEPETSGNYRVEVELDIAGERTPWIYSNPIRVTHEAEPIGGTTVLEMSSRVLRQFADAEVPELDGGTL